LADLVGTVSTKPKQKARGLWPELPSGKHTKNYGKSPFLIGESTINGHFQ
jgi:hypothetical protein